MPNNQELVYSLEMSRRMLHMFVDDLSAEERLFRACPGANCADWIVGHLLLVERMFHSRIGVTSPEIPADFESKFARDESAPKQADYGDTSQLSAMFDQQRQATIDAAKALTPEQLAKPITHPRFSTVGEALAFCALHAVMHAGQISLIRRALGKPPVV